MSRLLSTTGLPALAVLLVSGVLGLQLAHGGGTYEPLHPADPCVRRVVTSRAAGIDALTERLVLLGVDGAACRLGVSREELTLRLAEDRDPSDDVVDALHDGLLDAVARMKEDSTLPPISDLLDEALDNADLNRFLEAAIRALPDSFIDSALKTDDVLVRTIDDLDLREVLSDLDDQQSLNSQLNAAVTASVEDSLEARLRDLV